MPHPWETAPAGAPRTLVDAVLQALPQLQTTRLILRPAQLTDFATYAEIAMSDRATGFGGPMTHKAAWDDFNQMVASWQLRGFGLFTVVDKSSADILGFAPFDHEYGDPEPEIGWILTAAAEGRGIASEAGAALRDYAVAQLGTVVAYSEPDNHASHRVSAGLGGQRDAAAEAAFPGAVIHRFGGAA